MTLKIERIGEKHGKRIRLSGELRRECLEAVRDEIANAGPPVILDLHEVNLVDIDAVRWLNTCRKEGLQVENCEPYIREWMYQEALADKS